MAQDGQDFFAGYIDEVQTYIPLLQNGLTELRRDSTNREELDEIYRLIHIIKGASAMVGVNGLSQIAECMENAIEWIQVGQLLLSSETLTAMEATVGRIDEYCQKLQQEVAVEEDVLLRQTLADFGNIISVTGEFFTPNTLIDAADEEDIAGFDVSEDLLDAELLAEFRSEAAGHIESIRRSMQTLSAAVGHLQQLSTQETQDLLRRIRNSIHTVKGAARVIGLSDLSAFGQMIEEFLDWLSPKSFLLDETIAPLLAAALGHLESLINAPAEFDEAQAEAVLAQLYTYKELNEEDADSFPLAESDDLLGAVALGGIEEPPEPIATKVRPEGEGSLGESLFSDEEKQLLRDGFLEEAEEHFQQLHLSLLTLEVGIDSVTPMSPELREEIRKIRRAVHTIKGAAAVIGLNDISSYAHGVEDFLDWLFEGASQIAPDTVKALVESLDVLGLLVDTPDMVTEEGKTATLERLSCLYQSKTFEGMMVDGVEEAFPVTEQEIIPPEPPKAEEEEKVSLTSGTEAVKTIRINQAQLDSLVNLSNELLVGISGFDRNMSLFRTALEELDLTTRRLKTIALELEKKFEVKALDQLSEHFAHLDETLHQMQKSQSFAEFDALELDRYTQLNLIIRSLNESAIDVSALHTSLGGIYSGISGDIGRQHRVIRELQLQMLKTRLSPMSILSPRLTRTIRDVAARLGKKVRLEVEGEQVELDRTVWDKLADPLMHLARNAIHHGLESEADRLAVGKSEVGTISLTGRREGNAIVLRFSDDGQGLDFETIRSKAKQFGLGSQADQMDEQQLTDLIFYPGFSTKTISDISGRGVGMDVVKENVKELQGSVAVETKRGAGTTFVLRIPLMLGVVRALLTRINEVTYGLPLNDIRDIHRVKRSDIDREAGMCLLQGNSVPWYSLPALLGVPETQTEERQPLVVALNVEDRTIALSIPHITGQKEIVIKGLGSHLRAVEGIAGAAVMGDGSIVPVLNVPDLIRASQRSEQLGTVSFHLDIPKVFTVMIVDDSISIRRVMSRLVTTNGWHPVEAKDGLDAIEYLESDEVRPDCIVLDVEMPRMNGFEFLAQLPNVPGGKDIPVIMLTSRTSSKHQDKAFQLGAKAFLTKPCKEDEFVQTVRTLTDKTAESLQAVDPEVVA